MEWLQGLGIMFVILGGIVVAGVFVISNLGNMFAFLGNALIGLVTLCAIAAMIWGMVKLSKVFFKPKPPPTKEELFNFYIHKEVIQVMMNSSKKPAFYVLSAPQNKGISYAFISPVHDEKGRRHEIREKVIFHTIENQRFRGGEPHWL